MRTTDTVRSGSQAVLVLTALFLVAACLRPALTSVGAVLEQIGDTTGLSAPELGLLGALPLLGFAVVSPLVHGPAARWGVDRLVLVAMVVLCAGIVIRSLPPLPALWIGTAMIGASVAVGNVLVPAIIRRDQPSRIPLLTGVNTAVMNSSAALAAGLAVPVSFLLGSWRPALGVWAGLVAVAVLVWAVRMRRLPTPEPMGAVARASDAPERSVWASARAWQVTLFMGLQSTTFFTLINWLPTVEASRGVSPTTAGWHLFGFQVAGIVAGLAVTTLMGRRAEQRPACLVVSVAMVVAMVGLVWAPGWGLLWILMAGASTGGAIVVALALIALRGGTHQRTVRLSGMAQSMGYLLAAGGPVAAGALGQAVGAWEPVLLLVGALALAQTGVALFAGRPDRTSAEREHADR
ncbi:MFS transporter [Nocardiopsis sp. MG754419]|uniref:MFS transporter n=1 Tax=Nocardiopsis sp. MG754419 TaxID=2259865 RepID=UPI001BADAFF4|nr:MFS transporter [Nocardiopsis sp. MG754419]MBR8743874.1 MFS transporter [Nocardiopsis sp. MG754419]